MKIQLRSKLAKIPTRANPWDAGVDLYSIEDAYLESGDRMLIDTGVVIELPDGYVGLVCPRSGLAHKHGVTVLNSPGVIDSGYRGTIQINLINHGENYHVIEVGDKIAQLVIKQVVFPTFEVADSLSVTDRGEKGHGSSGK